MESLFYAQLKLGQIVTTGLGKTVLIFKKSVITEMFHEIRAHYNLPLVPFAGDFLCFCKIQEKYWRKLCSYRVLILIVLVESPLDTQISLWIHLKILVITGNHAKYGIRDIGDAKSRNNWANGCILLHEEGRILWRHLRTGDTLRKEDHGHRNIRV